MNKLRFSVVCLALIFLSLFSRELTITAPTEMASSYQRQYQDITQKGYLTGEEMQYLEELRESYLNSDERSDNMQQALNYKLYLGFAFALISFFGFKNLGINHLQILLVTLAVGLTSLFSTNVLEAFYYASMTLAGVIISTKHNNHMQLTPNNGSAD
ncbi:hypothetical protein QTP81_13650 [Alteromonas sp. ASW11-36]|uniref:Uncharacterized protein n=1 Tax=Alteromonas arenosi TaxID=3055817 RepID=A0ABT7SZM7_9ALTE|nr:hypothetical protein [Alteromonas sp. ASW11-36]MDM7861640.1 hypothetical protein [Alteromonas sp. ASW11-36]